MQKGIEVSDQYFEFCLLTDTLLFYNFLNFFLVWLGIIQLQHLLPLLPVYLLLYDTLLRIHLHHTTAQTN